MFGPSGDKNYEVAPTNRYMIESVQIQNYRSIIDTGIIDINRTDTTLVGGNEAGKTNVFSAIQLLGDSKEIPRKGLCDYISEKLKSKKQSEIPILTVEFTSDSPSIDSLLGQGGHQYIRSSDGIIIERRNRRVVRSDAEYELDDESVTVTRYADGTHRIQFEREALRRSYLVEQLSIRTGHLVRQIPEDYIQKEFSSQSRRLRQFGRRRDMSENLEGEFRAAIDSLQSYILDHDEAISSQYQTDNDSSDQRAEETIEQITTLIESYRDGAGLIMFRKEIDRLPHIEAFGDIGEIDDEVRIDKIKEQPNNFPAYSSILEFAGLEPDEMDELESGEIRDRRQSAGKEFTETFNSYWDQAKIEIEIELSGGRVSLQFYDESGTRKSSSDRSKGLRRFISFLAQVVTQLESRLQDAVILLDSPDVHLHPDAQKNMRESLSGLSDDNQLIIATHAPYMINTDDLTKIRVVERKSSDEGTTVSKLGRKETESGDSLAPVRAALGATFSDSLFSSSHSVLVEGFEDRLYLNTFSMYLHSSGRESFHPNMQLVDCGGATKTSYMGRLVDAENYNYIVVLDYDDAGRTAYTQLEESEVDNQSVKFVSEFVQREGDITIEDLIDTSVYCKVVSEVHDYSFDDLIAEVQSRDDAKGIVENVEGSMKMLSEGDGDEISLDKGAIAEYICKSILDDEYGFDSVGDETIETFSEAIRMINRWVSRSQNEEEQFSSLVDPESLVVEENQAGKETTESESTAEDD